MTEGKKIFTGLAVTMGILMMFRGIAAYQTDYDMAENTVRPGNNTTEIGEEFPSPTPIDPGGNTEIRKKIWVTNTPQGTNGTNVNCYIRMSLSYSNNDIGRAVTMKEQDRENWIYGDDGFYYYKNVLKEGESTRPLCTGFVVDGNKLEKTYWDQLKDFEIQVYEESVEADPYESYQAAWSAYEKQG